MIRANGVIGPLLEVLVYADVVLVVVATPRGIPYRIECLPNDEVEVLHGPPLPPIPPAGGTMPAWEDQRRPE